LEEGRNALHLENWGSFPPFVAIFTNDRLAPAPSCGRSAVLWVSDVTQKSILLGI